MGIIHEKCNKNFPNTPTIYYVYFCYFCYFCSLSGHFFLCVIRRFLILLALDCILHQRITTSSRFLTSPLFSASRHQRSQYFSTALQTVAASNSKVGHIVAHPRFFFKLVRLRLDITSRSHSLVFTFKSLFSAQLSLITSSAGSTTSILVSTKTP